MPVFRFRARTLVIALLAGSIASCRSSSSDARDTPNATARDDFGTAIAMNAVPRRIVSLNPTTTEILFAIGAGPRVVGRTHFDLYPAEAQRVPDLGPGIRPNVEAVLATRPDLVVLYASADDRPTADRLREAHIPVVAFKVDDIEGFRRVTRLLGRIVGQSARADSLVDSVSATLERVRRATASLPRPIVVVHTWDRPVIVIGGTSFLSELLDIAGARNAYADARTATVTVTLEDILRRDPDIVLAGPQDARRIIVSNDWRTLRAVKDGRVFAYDTNLVARPSVQLGAAAVSLANLFHPGAVR
ncbi:MAG TPA: helical backbone metal receptor [Gemmatimonadaceae bacterium]